MNPFTFFTIITIIYYVVRYKAYKYITENAYVSLIINSIYVLSLFLGVFFINLSNTASICGGDSQPASALIYTLMPFIVIFGLLTLLLKSFPGWLTPFSNTFGYLFAKLGGVSQLLNRILIDEIKLEKIENDDDKKLAASALEKIYNDKSIMINQITLENFENYWNRMSKSGLFKSDAYKFKDYLHSLVRLKTIVSEFIWVMLSGGLFYSISNNFIVNIECEKNSELIAKNQEEYEKALEEKRISKKQRRIYTIDE